MRIKATIVACAFLVQCFENATIVAYAGLRVKPQVCTDHTCDLCMCSYLEDLNFCGLEI